MKHRPGKARSLPPLPSTTLAPPEIRLANHSVMRTEWRDPSDFAPSAARVAKSVTGYRQYCPLQKCRANHGERSNYTVEHVLAADRLRQLADAVAIGFSPGREFTPVQASTMARSADSARPQYAPPMHGRRIAGRWRCSTRASGSCSPTVCS